MKFLVDAQLPPALADWLRSQGHEPAHVMTGPGLGAADSAIWDAALSEGSIIVSKDRDFAIRAQTRPEGPQVVWVRLGNATSRRLLEWLAPRWAEIETRLAQSARLVEVGRPESDPR